MVQVLREPTRKDALLDLLFVSRERFIGKVVITGCLGHSDHVIVELQIISNRGKTVPIGFFLSIPEGKFTVAVYLKDVL